MSSEIRLLLDENIHEGVIIGLQQLGIDAVHARGIGLHGQSDIQILDAAIDEQRILITRDMRDFIRIARFYHSSRRQFPGILLVPSSFQEKDPAPLIRAIQLWILQRDPAVGIAGGIAWLSQDFIQDGGDRLMRERQPAYLRALHRLETTA